MSWLTTARRALGLWRLSKWLSKSDLDPDKPAVAVVHLAGVLRRSERPLDRTSMNFDNVKPAIDKAFAMPKVAAVALEIDCPGGAPVQCERISRYIRMSADAKSVPVLAFAGDVAASGGYWLMCAGDTLYANRCSLVGSIGVVGASFGFVDAMKRLGIERRLYTAGKHKAMSDPFSEDTDEQDVERKRVMTSMHDNFKSYVAERRGELVQGREDTVFTGRVFTGPQALESGLVDGIGDMQGVLEDKFGKDVQLRSFNWKPKSPWWSGGAGAATSVVSGMMGVTSGDVAGETLRAAVEAAHDRVLWSQYGL